MKKMLTGMLCLTLFACTRSEDIPPKTSSAPQLNSEEELKTRVFSTESKPQTITISF